MKYFLLAMMACWGMTLAAQSLKSDMQYLDIDFGATVPPQDYELNFTIPFVGKSASFPNGYLLVGRFSPAQLYLVKMTTGRPRVLWTYHFPTDNQATSMLWDFYWDNYYGRFIAVTSGAPNQVYQIDTNLVVSQLTGVPFEHVLGDPHCFKPLGNGEYTFLTGRLHHNVPGEVPFFSTTLGKAAPGGPVTQILNTYTDCNLTPSVTDWGTYWDSVIDTEGFPDLTHTNYGDATDSTVLVTHRHNGFSIKRGTKVVNISGNGSCTAIWGTPQPSGMMFHSGNIMYEDDTVVVWVGLNNNNNHDNPLRRPASVDVFSYNFATNVVKLIRQHQPATLEIYSYALGSAKPLRKPASYQECLTVPLIFNYGAVANAEWYLEQGKAQFGIVDQYDSLLVAGMWGDYESSYTVDWYPESEFSFLKKFETPRISCSRLPTGEVILVFPDEFDETNINTGWRDGGIEDLVSSESGMTWTWGVLKDVDHDGLIWGESIRINFMNVDSLCGTATGIGEAQGIETIGIFPNPVVAGEPFTVSSVKQEETVKVYNLHGQLIQEGGTMLTAPLETGVYVVVSGTNRKKIVVTKLN